MATILASTLGAMGVGFTAGLGAAYMASPENRIRWRQGAAKRLRWIADNLELGTRKESVEIRRERRREVFDELNAR
jgi:thiamine pyrophosphate-dependent acetolactate synthase large subunit-like protein